MKSLIVGLISIYCTFVATAAPDDAKQPMLEKQKFCATLLANFADGRMPLTCASAEVCEAHRAVLAKLESPAALGGRLSVLRAKTLPSIVDARAIEALQLKMATQIIAVAVTPYAGKFVQLDDYLEFKHQILAKYWAQIFRGFGAGSGSRILVQSYVYFRLRMVVARSIYFKFYRTPGFKVDELNSYLFESIHMRIPYLSAPELAEFTGASSAAVMQHLALLDSPRFAAIEVEDAVQNWNERSWLVELNSTLQSLWAKYIVIYGGGRSGDFAQEVYQRRILETQTLGQVARALGKPIQSVRTVEIRLMSRLRGIVFRNPEIRDEFRELGFRHLFETSSPRSTAAELSEIGPN